MKKGLLVLFSYLCVSWVLATETQGRFYLVEKEKIVLGDVFQFIVELPYSKDFLDRVQDENIMVEEINKALVVSRVRFAKKKDKVIQVGLLGSYIKNFERNYITLKFGERSFEIRNEDFDLFLKGKQGQQKKDLHVLDREYNPPWWGSIPFWVWPFIALVILLSLPLVLIFLKKRWKKQKKERKKKQEYSHWKRMIGKAKTREEFEELYQFRRAWGGYVTSKIMNDFIMVVNQVQYQQDWSESDYQKVQEELRKIQRNLSYGV